MKFIGIQGPNSREWVLADIACMLYGYTSMPVYDTLGEEACEHMFNETELSTLFLTAAHAITVAKNIKSGAYKFLKNLVILDERNYDEKVQAACQGIQVYKFSEIEAAGKGANLPYPTIDENSIAFFSYTSGTTGKPKGAMISHRNVAVILGGAELVLPFEMGYTHLSYLPLAHVFERLVLMVIVLSRGRYGIFGGDVRQIKEDLGILKPDIFVSVPRLYNKFYETIQTNLRAATGLKAELATRAV
jgi:long-chain acyl-CoA synthetase